MKGRTVSEDAKRRLSDRTVSALLMCGIVSSLLYLFTDALGSSLLHGYRWVDQAVSELNAIGSPVRPLTLVLFIAYNVLVVAFAVGVWTVAGERLSLRITALSLAAYAVVGEVTNIFSPMNVRGSVTAANDVGHIVLTVVEVLAIVLFMAFGSGAGGRWFRVYSILTIVALVAAGAVTGMLVTHMTADPASTPWAGIAERVNIYGTMLWILMLSVVLRRAERERSPIADEERVSLTAQAGGHA